MISVLDLLRSRIGRGGGLGLPFEGESSPALDELMRRYGPPSQALPEGLPDAVQRSIQNRSSYGEGQIMAPGLFYNPAFEEEPWQPEDSPEKRESFLNDKIGFGRYLREQGQYAVPEGGWLSHGNRGFAQPLPSPLNQMLRRGPFALY